MSHVRTQIRRAFAAAVTGLSTTGTRVLQHRAKPVSVKDLPALRVYAEDEVVTYVTIHTPAELERLLLLGCDVYAESLDAVEDLADQIVLEVEQAIAADITLGGLCKSCALRSIESELDEEGEQPLVRVAMRFETSYYTLNTAPETAI